MIGSENSILLSQSRRTSYSSVDHSTIRIEDDAVTISVKLFAKHLTIVISLWLVSYAFVMLQLIDRGHFTKWISLLFIPMWIGSFLGIVSVIIIMNRVCCCQLRLVSKDERFFLQSQGRENVSQYIDYESLPLLRRLFFWLSVTALFILLSAITQVLFYLWLVEDIIGMWHALIPVVILFALTLVYMLVVKTVAIADFVVASCIVVELVLYATKAHNAHNIPWAVVLIPLWFAQGLWVYQLSDIGYKAYQGRYQLSERQIVCLLGYSGAILSSLWAEMITVVGESTHFGGGGGGSGTGLGLEDDNEEVFSMSVLPQVLWLLSVVIFVSCALLIMNMEAYSYADTRGHSSPVPLSKTASGWGPVDETSHCTLLLGTIRSTPGKSGRYSAGKTDGQPALSSISISMKLTQSSIMTTSTNLQQQQQQQQQQQESSVGISGYTTTTSNEIELRKLIKRANSGELEGGEDF